jgi:hypothetical protein
MNEPSAFGTNQAHPWYFDDPTHANTTPLHCPVDNFEMPPYRTDAIYRYDTSPGKDVRVDFNLSVFDQISLETTNVRQDVVHVRAAGWSATL